MVERDLFSSRSKAKAAILAGEVKVDGRVVDKAGKRVSPTAEIELAEKERYVSRGGRKLEKALAVFRLEVGGMTAADIGASTGGFTDCLLQHGARKVYAVDVGYGQLAWSLRNDDRVEVLERTNARYLKLEELSEEGRPSPVDLVTVDVSFISLAKILPAVRGILKEGGHVIALVKPQFEAGPSLVGEGGIVRDEKVHIDTVSRIVAAAVSLGFAPVNICYSPITGAEGNIEFFLHLSKPREEMDERSKETLLRSWSRRIESCVQEAHHDL